MYNLEQKDCFAHAALLEFAFGASVDSLCRKYGIEARELETLILQTSGMPILDDSTLSDLEAALRNLATKMLTVSWLIYHHHHDQLRFIRWHHAGKN